MARAEHDSSVLVGLALGDALGAPFEGRPRIDPAAVEAWRDATEPLRWTDDTHMALTLARHLIDDPHLLDPEVLGTAFARAYEAEPWRGYGAGPPTVFTLVETGWTFEAAAASLFDGAGSFGNGAAMRAAPVALLPSAEDLAVTRELTARQARLTHAHPDAIDAATVVAELVARLLRCDRASHDTRIELAAATARGSDAGPLREALLDTTATMAAGGDAWSAAQRSGTGVAAAASVPAALAAFLAGDDVLEVISIAISLGGDTDTIAAMAGAMAAASWGLGGVPSTLLDRLEAHDELETLALTLAAGGGTARNPG